MPTDEIRSNYRRRCFAMDQRKRMDLALLAFLRLMLGWSRALPASERDVISKRAMELVRIGEAVFKDRDVETPADFVKWEALILTTIGARKPFDEIEKGAEKEMKRLVMELPVWPWALPIRGFGAISLAVIIAETGDLSNYANPAKVWKRMGVGIMGGIRQGGLSKTAAKEAWIEHGYSRIRRSRMWTIGDALIKGNRDGRYRTIYLARKEYEAVVAEQQGLIVVPANKIPKGESAKYRSIGHIHRRAQRYMEKRLLKDLWRAWNRQSDEEDLQVAA